LAPSSDATAAAVGGLCRLVLDVRLIAIALTVAGTVASGGGGALTLALLLVMVTSYLPLRRWQRLGPELLRHPLYLGVDVALAIVILAVAGSSSPFFYFAAGTAMLAGILYGRGGAALFASVLVLGYLAVVALELDGAPPADSFQTLVALPALYPILAASGVGLRRLLDRQAESAEALRAATEAAAAADERARLAREMHDSLAKSLHGISLSASALVSWIQRDPDVGLQRARDLASAATGASEEARQLVADLRADHLDEPFPQVVREIAARWAEQAGTPVAVEVDDAVDLDDPGARYELACVLREALSNIERHAGAGHVQVRLAAADGHAELEIGDDGKGFTLPGDLGQLAAGGHYGVVGMSERACRVGGRLTVLAQPGEGTTVRVTAPLGAGDAAPLAGAGSPQRASTIATTS